MSRRLRPRTAARSALPVLFGLIGLLIATAAFAEAPHLKLAAALSLTGVGSSSGGPQLDGLTLAIEEANRQTGEPQIDLSVTDDHSSPSESGDIARKLGSSDALAVIGPPLTVSAIVTGPIYAKAGLVSIEPTANGETVPEPSTTFQTIFNTANMGAALANYSYHVLGCRRTVVLFRDDAFGRPIAEGFRRAAENLGLDITVHGFSDESSRTQAAQSAIAEAGGAPIALSMLPPDAVPLLKALRRGGMHGPILAPSSLAGDDFPDRFAEEPEETEHPGFFTDDLYATSSLMLDSASDEGIRFAVRFKERFGHDPSWVAVQGYDAGRLAVAALRASDRRAGNADLAARRLAVRNFLAGLDGPEHAILGVTGPLWFTPGRGRDQTVRMGHFHSKLFESAPVQLVPVQHVERSELESGAAVELDDGVVARRQRVVFTGIRLNELARLDLAQSRVTADVYVWLRYAELPGIAAAKPDDIEFPDLLRGTSDGKQQARSAVLADGSRYQLFRLRGDFRNEFDLRRFPVDRQTVAVRFFNARASSDSIIYAQDRRDALLEPPSAVGRLGTVAGENPFLAVPQWEPVQAVAARDTLVTRSGLGNPRLVGLEQVRESSGFGLKVELQRRVVTTLLKNLLPLGLMTLIVYSTLFFPAHLLKEKVTVEYVFYVFFLLCFVCILSFVVVEHLRVRKDSGRIALVERWSRIVYGTVLVTTCIAAILAGRNA
jgi:ABC-type branched-subunit amino acid transport system substrate-binding protein